MDELIRERRLSIFCFIAILFSILFSLFSVSFFMSGSFEEFKIKEEYCKHKYEKHLEVEECQKKDFPWEINK